LIKFLTLLIKTNKYYSKEIKKKKKTILKINNKDTINMETTINKGDINKKSSLVPILENPRNNTKKNNIDYLSKNIESHLFNLS